MKQSILQVGAFTCLAGMSPAGLAQTVVVSYDLDDVWLIPDISHPWEPAQQMTGSFRWTYETGDFENGSGQFLDLYVPWYGTDFEALDINVDLTSIEFTLPGNYHDLGLDLNLFLLAPLSPDQPAAIDTAMSVFEIQQGIIHRGHVVSGSIVPVAADCAGDSTGDGVVNVADLLDVLENWGTDGASGGDTTGDGIVNVSDLLDVLDNWATACG